MESLTPRPIVLLTDFGTRDNYVGQVKGVLAGLVPGAALIDLTHEVSPFDVAEGAWLLETALPALPPDAVVFAVVDPGVGSERLPLALVAGDRSFVGPDNGLLSGALADAARPHEPAQVALAGTGAEAYAIDAAVARPSGLSATFHGRDLFAPAAAALAAGRNPAELGPPLDSVRALPPFRGVVSPAGAIQGEVIHVDRYGNLVTTIRAEQLPDAVTVRVGVQTIEGPARTFSDVPPGAPLCHVDSSGYLAIAVNQGDAGATPGAGRGVLVTVTAR